MIIRLFKCLFLMLVLSASPLAAEGLTPRQSEILKTALSADGWLTHSAHQEFWAAMPKEFLDDPKEMAAFKTMMEQGILVTVQFQREAWESARQSRIAQKIVRTPGYEAVREAALSPDLAPGQGRRPSEASVRSADAMIEAAATGKPMVNQRGSYDIDAALIDETLAGFDGSMFRFRRLMNPVWSSEIVEYVFPENHIRLSWEGPFKRKIFDVKDETGKDAKAIVLSDRLSETEFIQIGFTSAPGGVWPDPEAAIVRTVESALKEMGVKDVQPTISRWRGRVAAEAGGTGTMPDGGILYASIRMVEAREHGGFWQIIGVSMATSAEAARIRDMLEQAVRFDE